MKINLFLIRLIILFLFFIQFSYADPSEVENFAAGATLKVEHISPQKIVMAQASPVDNFASLDNKININSENIKRNAKDILDLKDKNNNNLSIFLKLNKKTNENKTNINNIYNKLLSKEFKSKFDQTQMTEFLEILNKNQSLIDSQEEKINANENKLSDYLEMTNSYRSEIGQFRSEIEAFDKILNNPNESLDSSNEYLDRFWLLIAAVLVFFMQAGFKLYASGMVRKAHKTNVAIKTVLDGLIISLVYFFIGFGIMFGDSHYGFIGSSLFSPTLAIIKDATGSIDNQAPGLEFFLFQLALVVTAMTIVSGAMSERIALIPNIILSITVGSLIYPLFGHWAWGGTYLLNNQGWLHAIGFRDFAGSTVVHSIGAWVGLAGIIVIGARHGRYDKHGHLNRKDFAPANLGYSALGVLVLWFGWWGFNGGSQLKYDENIAAIIVNTIIAGSAAGLTAFFHAFFKSHNKNEVFPKLLGGILGGLVAITACCNTVSSTEAFLIGAIAGWLHNVAHDFFIYNLKLDDPLGAVAIHGFCGVWGTLCVAIFGDLDSAFFSQNNIMLFNRDNLFGFFADYNVRIKQAIIQIIGIITAFVFSFSFSLVFFKLLSMTPGIGLRLLPADEKAGSLLGASG